MTAELDRIYAALLRDDIPGPKEVIARVAESPSDELIDRIDDVQDQLGGVMQFSIMGDDVLAFAKVRGDPWELHEVLRELSELAKHFPIELDYEPEQDVDPAQLAAWVAQHPRPQPAGFTGAHITCHAPPAQLASIREALAAWPVELQGNVLRVAQPAAIRAVVDAVLRELVFVDAAWSVEVALEGAVPWRVTVSSFAHMIALGYLLAALVPYEPRDTDSEDHVELPVLSGAEQLEHHPPYQRGPLRRAIGDIAGEPVHLETKLRLGRIKSWLHYRGAKSRVFINAGAIAVDVDRVVLVAERNGVAELIAVALPGFAETRLRVFEKGEYGNNKVPRELACHEGHVILVWSDDDTRFVRDDEVPVARIPGSLERLDREGDILYAFTNDLYRISLSDGSVRAAGTRGNERVERFVREGRWYAWTFRDAREIYVAEDARVVRTFELPADEEMWTFALSPSGTLATITRTDDRYTLHVMYADHSEQFALAGDADIRFRTQRK